VTHDVANLNSPDAADSVRVVALDNLRAVLCDPEGRCCIAGSDADRKIVDDALAALAAQGQGAAIPADAWRYAAADVLGKSSNLYRMLCEQAEEYAATAPPASPAGVPIWLGRPLLEWALGMIDEMNDGEPTADQWAEDAGLYQQARAFLAVTSAPAASPAGVPDGITDLDECRKVGWNDSAPAYRAGWNACRAAMLAAAPSATPEGGEVGL
jgi:hypothetical protein